MNINICMEADNNYSTSMAFVLPLYTCTSSILIWKYLAQSLIRTSLRICASMWSCSGI